MLEKLFHLSKNGTNVKTELLAGLTTFLAMSYILAVNPHILGDAGMDKGAVFVATCIAAIIGCIIMAFVANWPIGMAPGMGLNALFSYGVVAGMGYSWQQALGAVFLSGIIFLILTATGIRKWLIAGISQSLRSAIVAGIGMFLAMVALQSSGIIVKNSTTMVGLGNLKGVAPALTAIGFFIMGTLTVFKMRGAILMGILLVTLLSFVVDPGALNKLMETGPIAMPPSLLTTFFQLDIRGIINVGILHILLVFVLVEIFDATGTLIGVGSHAGLIKPGQTNNLGKALFADSGAIVAGALIGTSSTTAYVESAVGAEAGGRTGLTALAIALCFALALFFSPLILSIPTYATAPALIFVACLMMKELANIAWNDLTEAAPAALTIIIMPLSYSIANGLACGFISYAVLKTLTGNWRQVHPAIWVVALLFIVRFAVE